MDKKLKQIWFWIGISVPILTTAYGLNQHFESSKQFQIDMNLENKESDLEDRYWSLLSNYNDEKISKNQYVLELNNLYNEFEHLKNAGYHNDWDSSSDERFFFHSIDLHMKFIQQKLNELKSN